MFHSSKIVAIALLAGADRVYADFYTQFSGSACQDVPKDTHGKTIPLAVDFDQASEQLKIKSNFEGKNIVFTLLFDMNSYTSNACTDSVSGNRVDCKLATPNTFMIINGKKHKYQPVSGNQLFGRCRASTTDAIKGAPSDSVQISTTDDCVYHTTEGLPPKVATLQVGTFLSVDKAAWDLMSVTYEDADNQCNGISLDNGNPFKPDYSRNGAIDTAIDAAQDKNDNIDPAPKMIFDKCMVSTRRLKDDGITYDYVPKCVPTFSFHSFKVSSSIFGGTNSTIASEKDVFFDFGKVIHKVSQIPPTKSDQSALTHFSIDRHQMIMNTDSTARNVYTFLAG